MRLLLALILVLAGCSCQADEIKKPVVPNNIVHLPDGTKYYLFRNGEIQNHISRVSELTKDKIVDVRFHPIDYSTWYVIVTRKN